MYRKLLSPLLSLAILLSSFSATGSSTKEKNFRQVQVTPEEFEEITSRLPKEQTQIHIAVREETNDENEKAIEDSSPQSLPKKQNPQRFDYGLGNIGSNSSNDFALVIFAVVGAFVIFAWVPYTVVYLYRLSKGEADRYSYKHWLQLTALRYKDDIQGSLTGIRYSFLSHDNEEAHVADYGLAAEVGYYHNQFNIKDSPSKYKNGAYWLIGPSITMQEKLFVGKLDLMAGTSFDNNLGLISKAEVSFHYFIEKNFSIGLNVGGIYLNAKDQNGVIKDRRELGVTYGVVSGFRF